ncbi:hypothetical protein T492DRAFT_992550, partial [Pavlovales sp. CCMP2436]
MGGVSRPGLLWRRLLAILPVSGESSSKVFSRGLRLQEGVGKGSAALDIGSRRMSGVPKGRLVPKHRCGPEGLFSF